MTVKAKAAVSAILLALLLVLLPWGDVRAAASRLPPWLWFAVVGAFAAGHAFGAQKWRLLLAAGRAPLDYARAVRFYGAGLFANLCLPSIVGGDVLRAVMAGKATGRPEAAFLAGIMDRLIDIGTLAILIAGGALFAREVLPGWGAQVITVGLVLGVAVTALALPIVLRRPLVKWPRKLRRPVGRALVALRHLSRRPAPALLALLISLAMQSAFVLLNVWIGESIGIHLPLPVWFMAWPLAKVAGLMPISLGGLAVRDATFGALLVPFGVPMAQGVVTALVWQTVMIGGGLIGGLAWWLLGRREGGASSFRELVLPARSHG